MEEEIGHRELGDIMLRRHIINLSQQLQVDRVETQVRLIHRLLVHLVQKVNRVLAPLNELLDGGLVIGKGDTGLTSDDVDKLLGRVAGTLDLEGQGLHVWMQRPVGYLIQ